MKINSILLPILVLCSWLISAQERYLDKKGVVVFEASEAMFEPVRAKNESVTVILDAEAGTIASLALVQGFLFDNALMQEHFNENYMESDLYPKAVFKGSIADFDITELGSSMREFTLKGTLEVRDKKMEISPVVEIQRIENVIAIRGEFIVLPEDFGIKIPKVVANKIAKEVKVNIDFKLSHSHEN